MSRKRGLAIVFGAAIVLACSQSPSTKKTDRIPYRCYLWVEDRECVDELPADSFEETIRRCSTDVMFDIRTSVGSKIRPYVHLDDTYHCSQGVAWTDDTKKPNPRRIFITNCKYPVWGIICWENEEDTLIFPHHNCGYEGASARKKCLIKYDGDNSAHCDEVAVKARQHCIAPSMRTLGD